MTWRDAIRGACGAVFGKEPTLHRIPFGPLSGKYLFMSCALSPRMYFGVAEPDLAELARKYTRRDAVVYDIGAHIGYTTLLFASRLGADGEVHSFEILPHVARQHLQPAVSANGLTNVFIHEVGLADRSRPLTLAYGPSAMANIHAPLGAGPTEACVTTRLDEFVAAARLRPPSLMKIDIEGAELECLQGAVETIRRHQPIMLIEFHSKELLEGGIEFLGKLGYSLTDTRGNSVQDPSYLRKVSTFYGTVVCIPAPGDVS